MSYSSHLQAIDCARRATDRAAAILHHKLSSGSNSLLAVADIAPLLGMFGTASLLWGVMRSYQYSPCNYGDCAGGPAEAFVPVLLSLPVAILARGGFHWLSHEIETLDLEMRTVSLDLLNNFAHCRVARR
jgi:biopolymer transport protein ExbB/TolQ